MADGMLRSTRGGQRLQRSSVDTGSGEKRVAQGRGEHLGRGSFVNFYEDLGISSTPDRAQQIRADEAKFQGQMKEHRGALSQAQGKYNEAAGTIAAARGELDSQKIPGFKEAYGKAWNTYQSQNNFIPVKVMDGQKVEGTYMLPKSAAVHLQSQLNEAYHTNLHSSGLYVDVQTKGGGGKRGAELHQAFGGAQQQIETEFSKAASPQIAEQLGQAQSALNQGYADVGKAESQLAVSKSEIDANKKMLDETQKNRDAQWADIRGKYQKRQDTMKEIFGGFNVGKGNGEAEG